MAGIARVYGTCNGHDIILALNPETRRWEVNVPKIPSGKYVVDLYAEDEAGNRAYYATVLIEVDFDTCKVKFTVLRIDTSVIPPDVPLPIIVDPNRYDGGSVKWT